MPNIISPQPDDCEFSFYIMAIPPLTWIVWPVT